MTSGVLVIDKPQGITSHDVVNAVRRLAKTRRVGHTGTLDPLATGVLVLLIGPATRLSRFIMGGDKRYRGVVRLGETTTTYDAEGDVTARAPVDVDRAAIEAMLPDFLGDIEQVPPMYAAIKVKGRKLYELAREGKHVERPPRPVTLYDIEILDWTPPDLALDVHCSSGTYIRSLAHDIGQRLRCGGHLRALRRLRSGPFTLTDATTLAALDQSEGEDRLTDALLPPQAALGGMPVAHLTPDQERAVRYGQTISLAGEDTPAMMQAHNSAGHLIAVLVQVAEAQYRPTLVLPRMDMV